MPPCIVDISTADGKRAANALQLNNLKKAIPETAFQKSFLKATFYMLFDYTMWFGSVYLAHTFCNSDTWATLPFWQQAVFSLLFWNFAGFFMWAIFIIGHDCGHTTFSDSDLLNDIVGHITHGSILVPYYPWQLSHRRHHMYHNHVDKDYSHPWYTPERFARPDESLAREVHNHHNWLFGLFPFYGWHIYLYGMPDGNHYIPFSNQRMWKESETKEYYKCILSTVVVLAFLIGHFNLFGAQIMPFLYYYGVPYVIFGWWLVTVTYLQHHNHDTLAYDDKEWKFVDAAFETVDRTFGFGLDTLHHHITDGHVAHHLFFTKIPHYNLPIATKAVKEYMEQNNLGWMYKSEKTYDFPYRVHSYLLQFGFKAHTAGGVAEGSMLKKEK
mmetsp:Transcript_7379/g.10458  ORF Transcript_7379/g.10458 Transcript_7379/m.10458 type:complete len:384 (+) Transcript_7379:150-1301(+)